MDLDAAAAFALALAATARAETLVHWRNAPAVEDKASGGAFDPVTQADRAAELAVRSAIEAAFPDHGIEGEEHAAKTGTGRFVWSIDPIDGTRSFICGLPTWTTLIALRDGTVPVLGVIDAPCLDETYVGFRGQAALHGAGGKKRLRTSNCRTLAEARFSTTDPFLSGPDGGAMGPILAAVRVSRFGHDAYAYARLAAGDLDLVVECGLKPHDLDALIPVVRGAGGHFGDWRGGSDFGPGDVVAAATKDLYDEAVELLASA